MSACKCQPLAQWRTCNDPYAEIFSTRFGDRLLKILRFRGSRFVPRGMGMGCVYTYDPGNTRILTRKGEGRRLPITLYGATADDVYAQLMTVIREKFHE